jgi:hypothetical protein
MLFALWLGVHLLTPTGFMPSFAGGRVMIVDCPGYDQPAIERPMAMAMPMGKVPHHPGGNFHQACPYAAASSLAGLDSAGAPLLAPHPPETLPPPARALQPVRLLPRRDLPPSRGPPLPA